MTPCRLKECHCARYGNGKPAKGCENYVAPKLTTKASATDPAVLYRQHFDAVLRGDEQAARLLRLQADYAALARLNRNFLPMTDYFRSQLGVDDDTKGTME